MINSNRNNSITNFIFLIFMMGLFGAWLYYYPIQSVKTLGDLRTKAIIQLDQWLDADSIFSESKSMQIETTPLPTIIDNQRVIDEGVIISPETNIDMMNIDTSQPLNNTGALSDPNTTNTNQVIIDTIKSQTPNDQIITSSGNNSSGDVQNNFVEGSQISSQTTTFSIGIGDKEIIIDGNPEEDVIINAGTYRVIVQKRS